VNQTEDASYREFVVARMEPLRRTAYLLCGNWHTGDDLVSIVLSKLYRRWRRIERLANTDAYVRRMLLNAWLDERRRARWREVLVPSPAEEAGLDLLDSGVTERMRVMSLLGELPPRRRSVLVLRFFQDLSVEETAELLGVSPGTVKSQTARALSYLRERLSIDITVTE
jgi:RNA polymerase sigma-70 factor (sigma-E family)